MESSDGVTDNNDKWSGVSHEDNTEDVTLTELPNVYWEFSEGTQGIVTPYNNQGQGNG